MENVKGLKKEGKIDLIERVNKGYTELKEMKDRIQGIIEGQTENKQNMVSLNEFLDNVRILNEPNVKPKKRIIIVDKNK